ncbi:MAG: HlyD family efflux transporter periplasmic adaptor subunit [Steroidobacteraceae bacterium]|nr:HlyD family efflux transporter periplasmic adaptor subunit [Steroidobacteraceae bacterium]
MTRHTPLAMLLVALTAGCSNGDAPHEVHGTLERDRLEIVAESNERIVEVTVQEGERVAAGAVLLRQEAGTMEPRLDQARASLDEAERRLAELRDGARQREIDEARAALAGAESSLEMEIREYDRVQSLVERKLVSDSNLDQARARRDTARSSRDQARARLQLLLEGTRTEQVQQAEAAVARSRAVLAELETSASRYVVHAPRAALVEALPYKLGERPPAGAAVAVLLADGVPYARVYVPEPLRSAYRPGAKVSLRVDGVEAPLEGVVRFVSAQASFTPYYSLTQKDRTRLSYLAEITVGDPRAADLPAGVPVQVTLGDAS